MKTITFKWKIDPKKIPYPTARACQYNGATQSPTWDNLDPSLTVTGQTSGKDAGEYTVTFTLDNNHCWMDGSTAPKQVTWSIGAVLLDAPQLYDDVYKVTYDTFANDLTTWVVSLAQGTEHVSLGGVTRSPHAGTYIALATADPGYAFKSTVATNAQGQVELPWTIKPATISANHLELAPKTYTGSTLMPDVPGFSNIPIGIMRFHVPMETDAGTYEVTCSLEDTDKVNATDYQWGDDVTVNDSGDAVCQWTIAKADCEIEISKSNVSLEISNPVQPGTLTADKTALAFIGIGDDYAQYIEVETNIPDGIEVSAEPQGIIDVEVISE